MPSYIRLTMEKIRQLRTEADALQEDLNADIAELIEAGLVASPSDEEPIRAVSRYISQKIVDGTVVSAADVKRAVACTRDLTHRGITALLMSQPLLAALDTKDAFGLKQFKRLDSITAAAPAGDC